MHIPPLKPHPPIGDEQPVKIADLPEWARPAFANMEQLNRIQSRVYQTAMKSPENMLGMHTSRLQLTMHACLCTLATACDSVSLRIRSPSFPSVTCAHRAMLSVRSDWRRFVSPHTALLAAHLAHLMHR